MGQVLADITASLAELVALQTVESKAVEAPGEESKGEEGDYLKVGDDIAHTCPLCDFSTQILMELQEHQRVHVNRGTVVACTECKVGFTNALELRAHQKAEHNQSDVHHCPKCGALFHNQAEASQHVKTVHGGDSGPPVQLCNQCGLYFSDRSEYLFHLGSYHGATRGGRPRARSPVTVRPFTADTKAARVRSLNAVSSRRARMNRRKRQVDLEYQLSTEESKNKKLIETVGRLEQKAAMWKSIAAKEGLLKDSLQDK